MNKPSVFATYVHGAQISNESAKLQEWPLVTFTQKGYRDSLVKRSRDGDLIIFVATKGHETVDCNKGRILYVAQFNRKQIETESYLKSLYGSDPLDETCYNEKGNFRWPVALGLDKFWRVDEPPFVTDFIGRNLKQSSRSGAEKLSEDESEKILNLKLTEIDISFLNKKNDSDKRHKIVPAKSGLLPSVSGFEVAKEIIQAEVYLIRFAKRNIWKVGWAFKAEQRILDINKHIPSELTSENWSIVRTFRCENQFEAYYREQYIFSEIKSRNINIINERFQLSEQITLNYWAMFNADFNLSRTK
jgi:hypothetical protein